MPSLHEPFGLVGAEAIGAGVPTLTHRTATGLGMFLADPTRVPSELGLGSTVVLDPADRVTGWADAIGAILHNLPAERERARQLREYLTGTYTWRSAAEHLVSAALQTRRSTDRSLAAATAGISGLSSSTPADMAKPGKRRHRDRGAERDPTG